MHSYAKRGLLIRLAYLATALLCWCLSGCGRRHGHRRVVLCYHNVTVAQRHRFEWQMRCVAHRRHDGLRPPGSLRRRPEVEVTFDDAFAPLTSNALPVLAASDIPATIFAVTGRCGSSPTWAMPSAHPDTNVRTLDKAELRAIDKDSLFRIESHTDSHRNLATATPEEIRRELAVSKRKLERRLGRPVTRVALPFGAGGETVAAVARDLGYTHIYALSHRLVDDSDQSDRIGRFSVSPDMWKIEYLLTLDGAYGWLGSWRSWLARLGTDRPSLSGRALTS